MKELYESKHPDELELYDTEKAKQETEQATKKVVHELNTLKKISSEIDAIKSMNHLCVC